MKNSGEGACCRLRSVTTCLICHGSLQSAHAALQALVSCTMCNRGSGARAPHCSKVHARCALEARAALAQAVLQLRLGYAAAKWRNVYKALTVLEFLVRRGAERCVALARSELLPKLEDLEAFQYVSPDGRDQGVNVRHRCVTQRLQPQEALNRH